MAQPPKSPEFIILNPRPEHFKQIQELCERVYPFSKPWSLDQLESHRSFFPDGQLIVIDPATDKVVGMAFSLIINWSDYLSQDSWKDFTSSGFFLNHNPRKGKTLYGAEVMVDPEMRGQGIGKILYEERKRIVEKYGLKRIRAGARLRGYGKFQSQMASDEYVKQVTAGKIYDPTLSFQLHQGFKAIDVAPNYLFNDPESLGYAAVIEWLNPDVATAKDYEQQGKSIELFFSGEKFVPEFLPIELRRLVRKTSFVLGNIIKECEGESFLGRVEQYRELLKRTRVQKNKPALESLLQQLKAEKKGDRLKLAHAFSLQLELVNACEAAFRTWRQHLKPIPQGIKSQLNLTYVLTAHPTEARSKVVIEEFTAVTKLLLEGLQGNFLFNEDEFATKMRLLWMSPLSKFQKPSVADESEYIYSLIFSEKIFDSILSEKPSYKINLHTWVGGDKAGHPYINKQVMRECLGGSRVCILNIVKNKMTLVIEDISKLENTNTVFKNESKALLKLVKDLEPLQKISTGDGNRMKAWIMKYRSFLKDSVFFVRQHSQTLMINRILEIFPGFVLPIELREDAELIKIAITDPNSIIRGMLSELAKISGTLDLTAYAKGLVISRCESADDMAAACKLVFTVCHSRSLPVIPLFETKKALISGKEIIKKWFEDKRNRELTKRHWSGEFEVMLGYSDSAKQIGVLPSRFLISKSMLEIEKVIKSHDLKAKFFHGTGGTVARGGGSLKEQFAWWSDAAVANPKLTVQGEMIQRQFATREILNSQSIQLAAEAQRRRARGQEAEKSAELGRFIELVAKEYSKLTSNEPVLRQLMDATPYSYLDALQINPRSAKKPETQSLATESLRAIPWTLCWTQTRVLLPTWWGVGTAWNRLSENDRTALKSLFEKSSFLSSFVKTLGFTLAKVELNIWQLYFEPKADPKLFESFRTEYNGAVRFVNEISKEKSLIWHRPWLEESIRLRSSNIHILNLLQIIALESSDEPLLRETLVGIACGMLTTG